MKKIALFLLAVVGIYISVNNYETFRREVPPERIFYVPRGEVLKVLSSNFENFIADLLLARAIIYFGSHYYQRNFEYRWLYELFDVATTVDPYNKEAFMMGARLLIRKDVHLSNKFLLKAIKFHPKFWKFPEMLGFNYFFYLDDPLTAAKWYERASKLPGHPPYVPSLASKFYTEAGKYREALKVLLNFYLTTKDRRLKKIFKKDIEEMQKKIKELEKKKSASLSNSGV